MLPAPSRLRTKEEVIKTFILLPLIEAHRILKGRADITSTTPENEITKKIVYNVKHKSTISYHIYGRHLIDVSYRPKEDFDEATITEPDIKFFIAEVCTVWIEAKRIYKDNSVSDYCGEEGLGRFLSGYYSRQDDDGGMIAYIQRGCISDIQSEIMGRVKIMDCIGLTENIGINASFLSVHKRITTGNIKMYHLFFDFVNPE